MQRVVLTAFFCNILWSLSYIFQKEASASLPLMAIVAYRFLLAALFLSPILIVLKKQILLETDLKNLKRLILGSLSIGFFCYFLCPIFQLQGISMGKASHAGILVVTEPIFGIILAWFFLGENISRKIILSLIIICLGVLVLSGNISSHNLLGYELVPNLFILFSIFLESLQGPISKKTMRSIHPFLMAFLAYLIGGCLALILAFANNQLEPFDGFNFPTQAILYLAIPCTTIAYSLWYWVLKKMPLSKAVLFVYLQPVFASIFAYFLLDEVFFSKDILAILLIFTGIWVAKKA